MQNKRYGAAMSLPLRVLLLAILVFLAYQGIFNMTDAELFDRIAVAAVAVLMAWIYIGTYYELRETLLFLRCGPLFMRIPYDAVESVGTGRSVFCVNFAFAIKCIVIKRRGKAAGVAISPEAPAEFVKDLKERCGL